MRLRKMLPMAAIAMLSIAPVAFAQDSLIIPNGDGTTRVVDPMGESDGGEDGDMTVPSSSQEQDTGQMQPVNEVAFTMSNGVQYIDLTCGIGQSITDHQDVFGTPGASCDINSGELNAGGDLTITDSPQVDVTQPDPDGDIDDNRVEEPDESREEPTEAPEDTEAPRDTEAPEDTENSEGNTNNGGLIVPETSDSDEPSDEPSESESEVDPEDVQKELNALGDTAENGMKDYLKGSPVIFEEHHDDVVMLMSMIAASEDGSEKIEGLIEDNDMLAGWINDNSQAISDKMNEDIDEQVSSLPERSGALGLNDRDVEKIVETFESIKSMMGGNDD